MSGEYFIISNEILIIKVQIKTDLFRITVFLLKTNLRRAIILVESKKIY